MYLFKQFHVFTMFHIYGRSESMELQHVIDAVAPLQCMIVMYDIGILAIDRLKKTFQPSNGNGRLDHDVIVRDNPKRKRT